jgi:site-specific DNA recombinase
MKAQIKAAGYIRVSTAIQVTEGESLDTQKLQIIDFIKQKGWELTKIYSDEGLSGTKAESRPQLQQLRSDARDKQFNIIVFTKLSRFARNAREYMNLAYELEQNGVQLASVKENIDPTTQTGKMITGILALFAEWEHETIREQMYENKMIRWRSNRTFIGKPPFGYKWNKEKKELEVVPNEEAIYHEIVKMYCEQGLAMRDIAIKLNERGLKCKRAVWNSGVVSYILKNPCYYGHYVVNQFVYVDGIKGAGTKRTKIRKKESEAIIFPIRAIVTKPEWDKIQETTQFRKIIPKHTGKDTMESFLRSVLICDKCGSRMNVRIGSKRKDGSVNRYYVCYYAGTSKKSIESKRQKCDLPYIKATEIERTVWANVMSHFLMDDPEKKFGHLFDSEKNENSILNFKNSILKWEADLTSKNRERERLFNGLSREDTNTNELWEKLRKNMDEILYIEGRLKEAKNELSKFEEAQKRQKEIYEFYKKNERGFETIYNQIDKLDFPDRKLFVEAMLDGPVRVGYKYKDNKYPECPSYATTKLKIKFNPEILQRLTNEGKIKLNINSSDHHTSPDTRGSS